MIERRLLAIYLGDHLAGSTGGVELARRARDSGRDGNWGKPLAELCAEIEADRTTLVAIADELGIKPNPAKLAAAWSGEKLGRLKLNGRLVSHSPLSLVVEMEMLLLGITGKLGMWRILEQTLGAEVAGADIPRLIERAEAQRQVVDRIRLAAAAEAFAAEAA